MAPRLGRFIPWTVATMVGVAALMAPGVGTAQSPSPPSGPFAYEFNNNSSSNSGGNYTPIGLTLVGDFSERRCVRITVSLRLVASLANTTADVAIHRNGIATPVEVHSVPLLLPGGAGGTNALVQATEWAPLGMPTWSVSFRRTAGSGTVYAEQAGGKAMWAMGEDLGNSSLCQQTQ